MDLAASGAGGHLAQGLYLDLIEKSLTGLLFKDGRRQAGVVAGHDMLKRSTGFDWPETAETMIGTARMRNLRMLAECAIIDGVAGDFIEAGVWRGGACIYLAAILAAYNDQKRRVFVADSFAGLPPPNPETYPADSGDRHHEQQELRVSADEVRNNFRRYGLLSDQIIFLEGWFKDTLPTAPIEKLAILRLDGDMYESTIQTLDALYAKVSPGGFVIIDDYILKPCAQAVDDFRRTHNITAPLQQVDSAAVWWQVPVGEAAVSRFRAPQAAP
ncbi:MAG: TylF/MycF family methyltransferase [Phreatobacter sp.]|nr:TylF/MycF family methyltransferase [Phreatobacter sp.]